MVTGKTPDRITHFAVKSLQNYFEQTASKHVNLYMIIINHCSNKTSVKELFPHENIFEYQIDRHALSLGEMRNLALTFVPFNNLWITWDDDDWRHPSFIQYMLKFFDKDPLLTCIAFSERYNYNMNTKFAWQTTLQTGYPHVLCKSNPLIRYDDVNTMEDINLIKNMLKTGFKVYIIKRNDPGLYIRIVHNDNTSLYVDKMKGSVNSTKGFVYKENSVDLRRQKSIQKIIESFMKE